ncbi:MULTISPECIES: thiol:disulfide interchange protein DsbG [unclassified Halomonas]|uniref:thiol:disulfide interchange protein DsbG n=1 Tax=unclassified Halomonas TaxID=2609666 RepID=UPI00209F7745|nr:MULTISPECIES: thiol:disulfide interchange protein DsbG [unclassified Halomonas]MCP1313471.1 thiol:disulfide interchange protein DsbG [Halomonas sp. 707D7]MCP1328687.1 thiol:disulfide interchange protein DsbG [Halomonas sp. 707D4]
MPLARSLLTLALASTGLNAALAADAPLPAPIDALRERGLEIHERFDAPGGLVGFGASAPGQEMVIYLTPDGEHAIIGTLFDAQGEDLSEAALETHVRAPLEAQTWQSLEQSHWVQDGSVDAPRTVYMFTDPNCTYCKALWRQTRPWVEAGEVQIRHILVGILAPNSPALAASLLAADDPGQALAAHSEGEPITASAQSVAIEEQVYTNNQLFDELGLHATPTSAFKRETENGTVRLDRIEGLPGRDRLVEMMGGEAPQ